MFSLKGDPRKINLKGSYSTPGSPSTALESVPGELAPIVSPSAAAR
jgi:hypothetical protein